MKKILVYRDNNEVEAATSDYRRAVIHSQKIIDFLKEHDISVDLNQVQALIKNSRNIATLFTPTVDLPKALRAVIQADNEKRIEELEVIVVDAKNAIFGNSNYPVDFSKLVLINGTVSMTEEAKQEAIERGSIYIDTDGRRAVYEKALAVQKAIEELQEEINNNPKKNINGWRLSGISPYGSSFDVGLLKVGYKGDVELSGDLFEHIV